MKQFWIMKKPKVSIISIITNLSQQSNNSIIKRKYLNFTEKNLWLEKIATAADYSVVIQRVLQN